MSSEEAKEIVEKVTTLIKPTNEYDVQVAQLELKSSNYGNTVLIVIMLILGITIYKTWGSHGN